MAIHYDPSSLDSNFTLLQALHRIEKYLHDNPIYKVYAVDTAYVVGTSQYDMADVDGDTTAFGEGDVVFFNNNYYAVVSSVGSELFSVKNASSFKGEQGADGAQGEQGEQGEDGKDALYYLYVLQKGGAPTSNSYIYLSTGNFNRTPVVNEKIPVYVYDTLGLKCYLCDVTITNVETGSGGTTTALITHVYQITGATGEQGESGEIALVYDQTISFTYSSSEQLIVQNLPIANFNRTPELNEDFVGLLYDSTSQLEYIANCEVQSISGTNVTSIVASNIKRLTGQDGQNGTNGTDGKDALACFEILSSTVAPVLNASKTFDATKFSRTPVANDIFTAVYNDTVTGKTYLCTFGVSSVSGGFVYATIADFVETTGATGASGTSLNYYTTSGSNNISKLIRIISGAKGHINGFIDIYVNGRQFGISINNFDSGTYKMRGVAVYESTNLYETYIFDILFQSNGTINGARSYYTKINTDGTITANVSNGISLVDWLVKYYNDSEIE